MKTTRTFLIILAIIVVLPFFGYFLWLIQKPQTLDLMIINKSVSNENSNEVKTLNWVLNFNKIYKSTRTAYDFTRDYYGFYPNPVYEGEYIQTFKLGDIPTISEQYDGVVFLDNKGVVSNALGKGRAARYGGFNQNDYILLKEMYGKGKLIIAEDNFFSEPTQDLVRFNTEQLLDIYSLHWTGKMFRNLEKKKVSEEIGKEWMEIYKNSTGEDWGFSGSGLILINRKQSRILVLPSDQYMVSGYPSLKTNNDLAGFYHVPESIDYSGWFQMVFEGKNQVVSTFDLQLNEAGKNLLKQTGLDYTFPAVIAIDGGHRYFFAGDFSKQNVMLTCSKNRVISGSLRGACMLVRSNPTKFFQNYYIPMMSTILENYINSEKKKKEES